MALPPPKNREFSADYQDNEKRVYRDSLPSPDEVVKKVAAPSGHDLVKRSDGTPIGNIADRFKVDSHINFVPSAKTVYELPLPLTNGGSNALNVNGSVTPVVFTAGPPAGQIWYVFKLGFIINDGGNHTLSRFGGIAGSLANGLLFEQNISSTLYPLTNLKNNLDIAVTFSTRRFRGQGAAFISDSNFFSGKVDLPHAIILTGDDSDVIRVTVRDDLSSVDILRASIEKYRVI